jgi:hypothetical protein
MDTLITAYRYRKESLLVRRCHWTFGALTPARGAHGGELQGLLRRRTLRETESASGGRISDQAMDFSDFIGPEPSLVCGCGIQKMQLIEFMRSVFEALDFWQELRD